VRPRRIFPSTRLLVLLAILVVIARSHVTLLPGWTVPLPALLIFSELLAVAGLAAWLLIRRLGRPVVLVSPATGT
jgi:hypothetical protein